MACEFLRPDPVGDPALSLEDPDYGAMLVEADVGTLSSQFITRAGTEIDRFTLTKSCT